MTASQLDQQVARRLTRFYVIALTIIAVLTVSGLLFIKHTINNHYDDSRVLNVAGRQRMFSQRLTKLALLRIAGIPSADKVQFSSLLNTWSRSHLQLRSGSLSMEKVYGVRKSEAIDSMFTHIDPVFRSIRTSLLRIDDPGTSALEKKQALATILRDEPAYLQQMNAIVFRFDDESFRRVRYLEQVEWLLGLTTLLVVLIEGLFIFRPVVRHTRKTIRQLTESEAALRVVNGQLEVANADLETANHKLTDTQKELLHITQEKYELLRQEDTVRSAALLEGQEEERRRFARELHDGIGQMLTGLKLQASSLKKGPFADEKQRDRFSELVQLIQDTIQATRQISHNLMPSVLGDFGLGAALQLLADQTAKASGKTILTDGIDEAIVLSPAAAIGLYRIGQEALNNAVKHADAQTIAIQLQRNRNVVVLTVADDGKGFVIKSSLAADRPLLTGKGLDNIRTRTRLLNGVLTITSRPGKGTRIMVKLNVSETLPS
jgi:signal transduction histidine kinase